MSGKLKRWLLSWVAIGYIMKNRLFLCYSGKYDVCDKWSWKAYRHFLYCRLKRKYHRQGKKELLTASWYILVKIIKNYQNYIVIMAVLYSERNTIISWTEQWSILQRASRVFVDTDSPAFNLRMVELLIPPLTWSVYVDAPIFFIVFHNGS